MKIKEVICPTCRKNLMYLKFEKEPGMNVSVPVKYVCSGGCPINYQFEWFNRFTQHEFLVLREGDNINNWLKYLKKDKKSKYRIKYKIRNKDGRKTN